MDDGVGDTEGQELSYGLSTRIPPSPLHRAQRQPVSSTPTTPPRSFDQRFEQDESVLSQHQ